MNKLEKRALICILFVVVLVGGMGYFIFKLVNDGSAWVSYPANEHIYNNGKMTKGTIYDRNGELLVRNTASGVPEYNGDPYLREANLHASGDMDNNINTAGNTAFAGQLVGYDFINGVYTTDDVGEEIYMTVDAEANLVAHEALGNRNGAVMVYNYETGEILVNASSPTFDPLDPGEIEEGAYINKGLSSKIVPGSIMKVVTSNAAIDTLDNLNEFEHHCTGVLEYGGTDAVTCPYAHGTVNFEEALATSCNGAFAILSEEIGAETLNEYVNEAGLTKSYNIDGIQTEEGSFEFPESGINLAWAGIGQHKDLLNPLSMMVYMGAIAGGGEAAEPTLLIGENPQKNMSADVKKTSLLKASTALRLDEMLKNNTETYGASWLFPGLDIYGKTGSAEVGGGNESNAWFTGYIRNEGHPYAFIVVIEQGGTGGAEAIPAMNKVLQYLVN